MAATPIDALLSTVVWTEGEPQATDDGTPYATHSGVLDLLGSKLRVHRLSNGSAVINADDLKAFFALDITVEA